MSTNPNPTEVTIPWWWRPALASAGVLIGLLIMGVGFQFADWFLNHSDGVETSVSCDDDYYYDEDEYEVEQFENEAGVWCHRTTEEVTYSLTHGWPVGFAAPVWVLACVLMLVLMVGGFGGALLSVVMMFDKEVAAALRDRRAQQLAAAKR